MKNELCRRISKGKFRDFISNKNIVTDMDGVLVNICDKLVKALYDEGKINKRELRWDWRKTKEYSLQKWFKNVTDESVYDSLKTDDNFYDDLQLTWIGSELQKLDKDGRLIILSKCFMDTNQLESKRRWLNKYFPNSHKIILPVHGSKVHCLRESQVTFGDGKSSMDFDVLMEDSIKEVNEFVTRHPDREYVIVDYGYNKDYQGKHLRIPTIERIQWMNSLKNPPTKGMG